MKSTILTFESIPLSDIAEHSTNPRLHDKAQLKRIAASISEYGFTNPVLIDEQNCLIAGHGRLGGASLAGLSEIPAIRITGLTKAQKRSLRIADNRIAERSTWSSELLAHELEALIELDFDLEMTGFDIIEIDGLMALDDTPVADDPPLAPPPAKPVSQPGDLWACGNHRIFCGDARSDEAYRLVTGGKLVDLVITDVPYNVAIKGNVSGSGRHSEFAMASGEMTIEQFRGFLLEALGHARNASRDGSLHYVFIDWRSIADLIMTGRELYSSLKNVITWVKPNGGMGSFYRSQHEFIAVFKHGEASHINNIQLGRLGRYRTNVWQYPGASGFSKTRKQDLEDHPTVKPVKLIADAIRDASGPGDLVLDPFGGAGTTMHAAESVGRKAALIEIEPSYVDVTLRRYQEAAGIEPLLLISTES
ncbi:site-specific DNA-methyltransferase [Sneathiella sp.]|uniref:site-specific DNA-methyltransferase n=1 Tax=Sneathiella sp. TaxID=1964365 RepID=UPI003567F2A2